MRPSSWIPAVVWMAGVLMLSSPSFNSQRTGGALLGLLSWVAPWLTPADAASLHGALRKVAHFMEYAILSLLWYRALVRDAVLTPGMAAACAFGISLVWAGLDETRQHFVPSRSGSVGDVAIDAAGSLAALTIARQNWVRTARALTMLLLWLAAVGGAGVLAINHLTGVPSGLLWVTVPAAAAALAGRWWWPRTKAKP
jgi:VanZ family protein